MSFENRRNPIVSGIALLAVLLLFAGPGRADTEEPESPRLGALRKEVAAGDAAAPERFWQQVSQEGTPLVEPAGGAADEVIVTFLWRGGDETRNVTVVASPADLASEEAIAVARMSRLPGTDVWFKSRRMRSDARFGYAFLVNDPFAPPIKPTEEQEEARWASLRPDPLNPRRAVEPLISLAELPAAPKQPWIVPRPEVPASKIEESTFRSERLGNERIVRVYTPPGYDPKGKPLGLLIVLDGRTYTSDVPGPTILDNLLAAGRIPPVVAVFIANPSPEARVLELSCHPPFAEFLGRELIPWVLRGYRVSSDPARTVIAGSSLGGLAAACAAMKYPEIFGTVLSISGSFYWKPPGETEPEGIARRLATGPKLKLRFYLEAGLMEGRPRPETPSLLESNRHLRTVLRAKGYDVKYQEFNGGHSILNWRGSFANGLLALLGTEKTGIE
jgi:enterochelin esterase-like enzyme